MLSSLSQPISMTLKDKLPKMLEQSQVLTFSVLSMSQLQLPSLTDLTRKVKAKEMFSFLILVVVLLMFLF
jgi:hypothetical protein